ncbi:PIG-L family deacetylase [SAR92 clade bacterium H231]|nr:PIG-L family deacetylase [SAR92 clade bacterium H231]
MSDVFAVIAAHPDDEVLGCAGTIAKLVKEGHQVHILLMADGESSRLGCPENMNQGKILVRSQAALRAAEILGCTSVEQLALPDNRMDTLALLDIVQPIEKFIGKHDPTTVFTHHSGDVNIDHRIVHDAVIAACRPQPGFPVKELLFFEVASSTEWRPPNSGAMFNPNWFVDITSTLELKLEALAAYQEELRPFPHPRSDVFTRALAQYRGASVGVCAAEAFILGRKIT